MSHTLFSPWIALAVGLVMLIVVLSYRQTVHAYPSGGGDYGWRPSTWARTAGRGQRAARGLRAHRRGLGVVGRDERQGDVPLPGRARGACGRPDLSSY